MDGERERGLAAQQVAAEPDGGLFRYRFIRLSALCVRTSVAPGVCLSHALWKRHSFVSGGAGEYCLGATGGCKGWGHEVFRPIGHRQRLATDQLKNDERPEPADEMEVLGEAAMNGGPRGRC